MPISPVITTTSIPMIVISPSLSTSTSATITTPQVTYSQILASLGTMVYGSEFIYMASDSYLSIIQTFSYVHFSANGNRIQTFLPFTLDPYQAASSIYYETNPDEIILDGFSSLSFTLKANSTIYFKMYTLVSSNSLQLNELHDDAFQDLEKLQGFGFFYDFCNYLIEEEDATT